MPMPDQDGNKPLGRDEGGPPPADPRSGETDAGLLDSPKGGKGSGRTQKTLD